jgi:hypothetical protein
MQKMHKASLGLPSPSASERVFQGEMGVLQQQGQEKHESAALFQQ